MVKVQRLRFLVVGYNAFDVTVPFSGPPVADAKHEVEEIYLGGGGPGATAAVALARLGGKVRLATPLTDDLPGQLQEKELLAAGVDLGLCQRMPGHRTAKAVILADAEREYRTIFWSRGDLPRLDPDLLGAACLEETDLLYLDGHEPSAQLKLARLARDRGIPVVMDAGSVREDSKSLVACCTDVISSERFAPDLAGTPDPVRALQDLERRGPRRVAMTFGAGGMLGLFEGRPLAVPSFAVPVLDTTGAGDVFHAGYAYARALGLGFPECLRYGAATAALKCRRWGGRPGIPSPDEVRHLLDHGSSRPLDPRIAAYARRN